jgi:hypothetical protein
MDKLKILDASFLYAETANTPMHVAGLQHFELPPGAGEDFFEMLRAYLAERVHLIPFMTRCLKSTPLGMDHPVWIRDEDFEIDRHVRRIRVSTPGTPRQLEQVVARLHEEPLDRSRPLWQFWFVDGLEDGSVALYSKYHHACIDGMAGQAIIDILFNEDASIPPVGELPTRDDEDPGLFALLWDAARNAGMQPVRTVRGLPDLVPLSLRDVKAVGRAHDCKVNDVFMAVCAGALARYLDERGELPERPLIAGAPVSLRAAGDASMSNQVSMLLTSLETQRSDPLERLLAIRDSALRGKAVVSSLGGTGLDELAILGLPAAFRSLVALADRLRLGDYLPVPINLVISNVPGPRREVFLAGARMRSHYPVSIPAHGNALNITVQSYLDRMDFSLTACLDTLPDADRLRDFMLDAFEELRALRPPHETAPVRAA